MITVRQNSSQPFTALAFENWADRDLAGYFAFTYRSQEENDQAQAATYWLLRQMNAIFWPESRDVNDLECACTFEYDDQGVIRGVHIVVETRHTGPIFESQILEVLHVWGTHRHADLEHSCLGRAKVPYEEYVTAALS